MTGACVSPPGAGLGVGDGAAVGTGANVVFGTVVPAAIALTVALAAAVPSGLGESLKRDPAPPHAAARAIANKSAKPRIPY